MEVDSSVYFPGIAVVEGVMDCLELSQQRGRRQALKVFRDWVREQL